MKKLRIVFVGIIASLFLMTLSISCDADEGADIQKVEQHETKAINKGEIGNDDI